MVQSGIKKMRQVDNAIRNEAEAKRFYEEVYKHYGSIKRLVNGEISKGTNIITAIDRVLNNDSVSRLYPELRKSAVKRTVRSKLLDTYFSREIKQRKEQEQKESQGEGR